MNFGVGPRADVAHRRLHPAGLLRRRPVLLAALAQGAVQPDRERRRDTSTSPWTVKTSVIVLALRRRRGRRHVRDPRRLDLRGLGGDRPERVLRRPDRRRDRRQRRRALGRDLLRGARQDGPRGEHRDRLERPDRAVRGARCSSSSPSSSGRTRWRSSSTASSSARSSSRSSSPTTSRTTASRRGTRACSCSPSTPCSAWSSSTLMPPTFAFFDRLDAGLVLGGVIVVLLLVDLHFFARGREATFAESVRWSIGWLVLGLSSPASCSRSTAARTRQLRHRLPHRALAVARQPLRLHPAVRVLRRARTSTARGCCSGASWRRSRCAAWRSSAAPRSSSSSTSCSTCSACCCSCSPTGSARAWARTSTRTATSSCAACARSSRSPTASASGHWFSNEDGTRHVTPIFLCLAAIVAADIAFAVDSIPAAFAITRDPLIIWAGNVFALLGLRALFVLVEGLIKRFRYLDETIAVVLGAHRRQAAHRGVGANRPGRNLACSSRAGVRDRHRGVAHRRQARPRGRRQARGAGQRTSRSAEEGSGGEAEAAEAESEAARRP